MYNVRIHCILYSLRLFSRKSLPYILNVYLLVLVFVQNTKQRSQNKRKKSTKGKKNNKLKQRAVILLFLVNGRYLLFSQRWALPCILGGFVHHYYIIFTTGNKNRLYTFCISLSLYMQTILTISYKY